MAHSSSKNSFSTVSIHDITYPITFPQPQDRPQSKKDKTSIKRNYLQPPMPKYEKKTFTGEYKHKIIKQKVNLTPLPTTKSYKRCGEMASKIKKPETRLFQKTFCDRNQEDYKVASSTDEILQSVEDLLKKSRKISISQRQARTSTNKRMSGRSEFNLSDKMRVPCIEDVLIKGKKYIGKCTEKQMRSEEPLEKFKFSLTEDPRENYCLKNPYFKVHNITDLEEQKIITENVKLADNVESVESLDNKSSSICEEIDLDNPFKLDYQGLDYKNTFEKDEQVYQNISEYRDIQRFVERVHMKNTVAGDLQKSYLEAKTSIPEIFHVNIDYDSNGEKFDIGEPQKRMTERRRKIIEKEKAAAVLPPKLVSVSRTEQKDFNKLVLEMEYDQRLGRRLNLNAQRNEYEVEQQLLKENLQNDFEKYKATYIGEQIFEEVMYEKTVDIDGLKKSIPSEKQRRTFPTNMKETLRFRHQMKKTKKENREKGKIREEFYGDLGRPKWIPDAHVEFSDLSKSITSKSSESSGSDNLDKLGVVDGAHDKFLVRGFHCDAGEDIRGKLRQKGKGMESRCITRAEWIDLIAPDKKPKPFFTPNETSLQPLKHPDDPTLVLFPKGIKPREINFSYIRKEVCEPIGQQYKKKIEKIVHLKKPKTRKVKKFYLSGFMFGVNNSNLAKHEMDAYRTNTFLGFGDIFEFINAKIKMKRRASRKIRQQRKLYLGIPIAKHEELVRKTCKASSSESSDWIPKYRDAPNRVQLSMASTAFGFRRSYDTRLQEQHKFWRTGDLKAPKFREPTLRKNAKLQRDSLLLSARSLDQLIKDDTIPYVEPPDCDRMIHANLHEPKKEYFRILDGRHHHDHKDPTEHKIIRAKYLPKPPLKKPEHFSDEKKHSDPKKPKDKLQDFEKAIPATLYKRDKDLSIMHLTSGDDRCSKLKKENVAEISSANKLIKETAPDSKRQSKKSEKIHSLETPPTAFELRNKFVHFIKDMLSELKKQQQETNAFDDDEEIIEFRNNYLKTLNDELESIKGCLSSLDSSVGTNFTNDSGSYILLQKDKVPLDFIRKPQVPFEEIDRARVVATPIKKTSLYHEPFNTCPFSGQLKDQTSKVDDKFHSYISRAKSNFRQGMYIQRKNIRDQKLGVNEKKKYRPEVAIDVDETYISELSIRPPVKRFKPKTTMALVKGALRNKYVCWSIQQKIVEQKEIEEIETRCFESVMAVTNILEDLFAKWEKKFYEAQLHVVSHLKSVYDKSALLKEQFEDIEHQFIRLNMDIIFMEYDWKYLVMLQNFSYLIKDNEWRKKNDWIHQNEDGRLEGFAESIQKREIVNIRPTGKNDAWVIKDFYENVYLKNVRPMEIVFPDAESFIVGVNNLRSKTFKRLHELHFTLQLFDTLNIGFDISSKLSDNYLNSRKIYVNEKQAKAEFMIERQNDLARMTKYLLEHQLPKVFKEPQLLTLHSLCDVMLNKIVSQDILMNLNDDVDLINKMSLIWETITLLLQEIDEIPKEIIVPMEKSYRSRLKYQSRISRQQYELEKRLATTMENCHRILGPPYIKPKREGKLQRLYLKPRKPPAREPSPIRRSINTKFFYDAPNENLNVRPKQISVMFLDSIEEDAEIPFHMDHFLRLHNYEPNYNVKTMIELRDGPEEKRFKCKAILTEVMGRLMQWEAAKMIRISKEITDYEHIYENM